MFTYHIYLQDYFLRRDDAEEERASRARTKTKVKKIPRRFPSVNNMYPIVRGGRGKRLSTEGTLYKDFIFDGMSVLDGDDFPEDYDYYDCTYVYFMTQDMLFYKNESLRQTDVSNYLKATEDAVFKYLMANDSQVLSIRGYKRLAPDNEASLLVLLSPATLDDNIEHAGKRFSTGDLTWTASSTERTMKNLP